MVCLNSPNPFKFFKGCLPQILLGPFLNTVSYMYKKSIIMRLLVVTATFLMTKRKTLTRKPTQQSLTNQCVNHHQGKNLWWNLIRKRKVVRSQTQVLLQVAGSLNQLVESHAKRHKEQSNFEKERDKAFLGSKETKGCEKPSAWDRNGKDLCWIHRINAFSSSSSTDNFQRG